MGIYINQADIELRVDRAKLIQLTDDAKTGQVNSDVVNSFIDDAEGTVESHLRTRYTLPVPATHQVKNLCIAIAGFKIVARRATSTEGIYAVWEKAYNDANKFLEKVQAGKASLDVPAKEETRTNPASADEVLSGPSRPGPFSDEKLRSY